MTTTGIRLTADGLVRYADVRDPEGAMPTVAVDTPLRRRHMALRRRASTVGIATHSGSRYDCSLDFGIVHMLGSDKE